MNKHRIMKSIRLALFLALVGGGCALLKPRMLERSGERVTVGTYRIEMSIARPPEQVFSYLSSMKNFEHLMDYVDWRESEGAKTSGVGEFADGTIRLLGLSFPIRYVIVQYDPDKSITIALAKSARGWMTLNLEPENGGTRLKGNLHLFVVRDSLRSLLINFILNDEDLNRMMVRRIMTEKFIAVKAELEGRDPASITLDQAPSYSVFVDAYFMVKKDFALPPLRLYRRLGSVEALNQLFTGRIVFTRVAGGPGGRIKTGDRFRAAMKLDSGRILYFDAIAVQSDPGQGHRMVLLSPDVTMEWDFLVFRSAKGSQAAIIMIVNFSDNLEADTLDTLTLTSELEGWAREGLQRPE